MKRKYVIPEMTAVYTAQTLLQSGSSKKPQVGINSAKSVDAGNVEAKGQGDAYDVWDEDWSR